MEWIGFGAVEHSKESAFTPALRLGTLGAAVVLALASAGCTSSDHTATPSTASMTSSAAPASSVAPVKGPTSESVSPGAFVSLGR